MGVTRTPRSGWIDEGLRALSVGGPESVRVESLAQELGVSKGGFYWHFADRGALLGEMLDVWEREMTEEVILRVEEPGGDARAKLKRLFTIAATSDGPTINNAIAITTDLAVRDWSRRDPSVADRLRRVDNRRMDYLRSLFGEISTDEDDVEARSVLAFTLWIGNHFMAADHGVRSRADVLSLATKYLLN